MSTTVLPGVAGRLHIRAAVLAVTAALLAVGGAAAPAGAAPARRPAPHSGARATAPQPVTFGIDSASATRPDTRYKLNYDLDPGAATKDHVAVVNNSSTALTLDLYAADGANASDGKVEYLPRGKPGSGARTWITLGNGPTIRVPARSTRIVGVTIAVPATATPGDHVAGIVVSLPGRAQTSSGQKVEFDQGVGLAATFHVSGTLAPALQVTGLTTDYDGTLDPVGAGSATVHYTVRNTGNVILGATQHLSVGDLFGSHGPSSPLTDIPPLLPGSSVTRTVRVDGVLPTFRIDTTVRLTPRPAAGDVLPALQDVSAGTGSWAVPWPLIALVALVVLLVLAWRAWRRAHPATESRHSARGRERTPSLAGKA